MITEIVFCLMTERYVCVRKLLHIHILSVNGLKSLCYRWIRACMLKLQSPKILKGVHTAVKPLQVMQIKQNIAIIAELLSAERKKRNTSAAGVLRWTNRCLKTA